jgi:16S rRNA (guanine527-N7)-methyltransferase
VRRAGPTRSEDPLDALAEVVRQLLGRGLSRDERRRFGRYLDLLLLWNRTHRITGVSTPGEVVDKLFKDALLVLPLLPPGPIAVVDIGTGAGIPGVPLRIVDPRITLTLIEARRKRVSFLNELTRALDLPDVEILHGRAEALATERPGLAGRFDAAVSRAAGGAADLAKIASTYVKCDGVIVIAGPPPGRGRLLSVEGSVCGEWRQIPYPELGISRVFFVARKGT